MLSAKRLFLPSSFSNFAQSLKTMKYTFKKLIGCSALTGIGLINAPLYGQLASGDIIGIDFQPDATRADPAVLAAGTNFNVFDGEFLDGTSLSIPIAGTLINTEWSSSLRSWL